MGIPPCPNREVCRRIVPCLASSSAIVPCLASSSALQLPSMLRCPDEVDSKMSGHLVKRFPDSEIVFEFVV